MRAGGYLFVLIVAAIVAVLTVPCDVHAQAYPNKPIRFVVPFAAGGGVDLTARIVAQKMSESLGQPVLVDNRTGAGGIVGADVVAKSQPDGYTFLVTTSGHTILQNLYKTLPWDPIKDFSPVSMVVSYPLLLVVNPSVPANSASELIALAKAKPGALNYGTGGVGTPPNLAMELLKSTAGINVVHVPYQGNGPATIAVMKGEVQIILDTMIGPLAAVRAGKLRALAVTSSKRSPLLPEVPTLDEAAMPGYVFEGWTGMFAPASTPADIIDRIHAEVVKALAITEVKQRLIELGYEPVGNTPQQFSGIISEDLSKISKIVERAGIKAN
jgi:tripartite-type tricarboxylate transporter receptor subunit TctC